MEQSASLKEPQIGKAGARNKALDHDMTTNGIAKGRRLRGLLGWNGRLWSFNRPGRACRESTAIHGWCGAAKSGELRQEPTASSAGARSRSLIRVRREGAAKANLMLVEVCTMATRRPNVVAQRFTRADLAGPSPLAVPSLA